MSAASVLRRISLLGRGWCSREALGAWAQGQDLSPDELDRLLGHLLLCGCVERRWLSRNGSWVRVAEYRAIRDMAPPPEPAVTGPVLPIQDRVAEALATAPASTGPELMELLGLDKGQIYDALQRLLQAGRVTRVREGRTHRYRLSEAA